MRVVMRCADRSILTLPSKCEHLQILFTFICVYLFLVFDSVVTVYENDDADHEKLKTGNIRITESCNAFV
jgi:hypothetical protein